MPYRPPPGHLPPQVAPQPLPAAPLAATIHDLSGWWLEVRCVCGRRTDLPLRLMCAQLILPGRRSPMFRGDCVALGGNRAGPSRQWTALGGPSRVSGNLNAPKACRVPQKAQPGQSQTGRFWPLGPVGIWFYREYTETMTVFHNLDAHAINTVLSAPSEGVHDRDRFYIVVFTVGCGYVNRSEIGVAVPVTQHGAIMGVLVNRLSCFPPSIPRQRLSVEAAGARARSTSSAT
jgi:hypothetical protein